MRYYCIYWLKGITDEPYANGTWCRTPYTLGNRLESSRLIVPQKVHNESSSGQISAADVRVMSATATLLNYELIQLGLNIN